MLLWFVKIRHQLALSQPLAIPPSIAPIGIPSNLFPFFALRTLGFIGTPLDSPYPFCYQALPHTFVTHRGWPCSFQPAFRHNPPRPVSNPNFSSFNEERPDKAASSFSLRSPCATNPACPVSDGEPPAGTSGSRLNSPVQRIRIRFASATAFRFNTFKSVSKQRTLTHLESTLPQNPRGDWPSPSI